MARTNKATAQALASALMGGDEQTIRLSETDSLMFAGFPDLLTIQHMELILGCSGKTVRKLIADGELPGKQLGERWYVPKARLIEYFVGDGCANG